MDVEAIVERIWPGRGARRGARRRHHEPQLQGRARTARPYVLRIAGTRHRAARHRPRASSTKRRSRPPPSASGRRSSTFVEPEGYLVTRFIEGEIVPVERMREPATIRRVVARAARRPPGAAVAGALRLVPGRRGYRGDAFARGVESRRDTSRPPDRAARSSARAAPMPERPCHNDLLNANFIDDGTRIRIVDWEYAGMGDIFFDLANFAVNHDLDEDGARRAARGVLRRCAARRRACARDDAVHVGLPRGDVGRRPGRGLGARFRLRAPTQRSTSRAWSDGRHTGVRRRARAGCSRPASALSANVPEDSRSCGCLGREADDREDLSQRRMCRMSRDIGAAILA